MATVSQTENNRRDIVFILDESGSMSSMGNEPIQAVNNFIKDQKNILSKDGSTFSLWKFNSIVTNIFNDIPLEKVTEFTNFVPDSMTALYDAIGKAINSKKEKQHYENVICVILTDGLENSSTQFTYTQIRDMIKEMEEKHNWNFIYLGANQDAFSVGNSIGVKRCARYDTSGGELLEITRVTSEAVSSYRKSSSEIGNQATLTLNVDENMQKTKNRECVGRQCSAP